MTKLIFKGNFTKIINFIVMAVLFAAFALKPCKSACTTNTTISVTTTGTFTSSGYPTAYSNNEHCGWYLQASAGNAVKIVMSVKTWGQGGGDFYSIYDGDGTTGNILISNSYAENSKITIQSRGQNMFVYYLTNGGTTAQGFTVTYSPVTATGLTAGSVENLNYGVSNYAASERLTWIINALSANRMLALFTPLSMDMYCAKAIVRDGDLSTSPPFFDSSYINRQYAFCSSGPAIQAYFDSGTCSTGTGVSMTFQEQSASDLPCTGTTVISGQTSGTLQIPTPNVGGFYNPGDSCSWQITVAPGYSIGIKLTSDAMPHWQFIEGSPGDWIYIHDGPSIQSRLIFTAWAGYSVTYITTTSNSAFIRFTADSNGLIGLPYSVIFTQIPKQRAYSGYIRTVGYPNSGYKTWENSVWVLSTSEGGTISFDISTVWLQIYDPVTFYDGPTIGSTQIAKVIDAGVYASFNTTGRHLTIGFNSDGGTEGNGWIANFNETAPPCQTNQTLYVNGSTNITFTSTNYPINYSNLESCGWLVVADTGFAVEMTISTLSFDQGGGDWYAVYDGFNSNAPQLTQTKARQSKIGLTSRSNAMFLYFVSDNSTVGQGFSVSCRQVAATGLASGYVQNVNLGVSPYAAYENIVWVLGALPSNFWLAYWTPISLDMSCATAYVRNGPLSNSPSLHTSTYVNREYAFRSSGQYIQAALQGGACASGTGVRMRVQEQNGTTPSCSGITVVNGLQNGTLQIPPANIFGLYNPKDNCSWLITVAAGYSIGVTMTATVMPYSQNLGANPGDFIYVYDGENDNARLIFKAMGGYSSSYITTTSNNAFISFIADSDSLIGFPYIVTFQQIAQRGLFSGLIRSIGYPTVNYKTWEYSIWSVRTTPGRYIDFDIYSIWLQSFDPVAFYDGPYLTSPQIASVICQNCYSKYNTTNSTLTIKFYSDGASEGKGWIVTFNETGSMCNGINLLTVNATTNGTFTSSNYPANYQMLETCGWLLETTPGYAIEILLSVGSFQVSSGDSITIYDGNSTNSSIIFQSNADYYELKLKSRSNKMLVYFVSDASVSGQGFQASYWRTNATGLIGGKLSHLSHVMNEIMYWDINGINGSRLWLALDLYKLAGSCAFLDVVDGKTVTTLLSMSFGNHGFGWLTSQTSVRNRFQANSCQSSNRLYDLTFQEQLSNTIAPCTGHTVVPQAVNGTLQIPTLNIGGMYSPNDSCSWLISVPSGYSIGIIITSSWNIDNGDYMLIFDGATETSLLMKTYSSYSKAYVTTTSNSAFIRFTANSDLKVGTGFTITYQQIIQTNYISGYLQNILFPGGPYKSLEDNGWLINARTCDTIHYQLAIGNLQPCCDFVTMYDGNSTGAALVEAISTDNYKQHYHTSGPSLFVTFISSNAVEYTGWSLSFSSVPANQVSCSGISMITGLMNGSFQSNNYSTTYYLPNQSCGWAIMVEPGYVVELTVVTTTMGKINDWILLYDIVDNTSYKMMVKTNAANAKTVVTTTTNFAYVKFVSDGNSLVGYGFSGSFLAIPQSGPIPSGYLQPKDFRIASYSALENSQWILYAETGNRIGANLTTDGMNSVLLKDYVDIYDGPTTGSTRIAHVDGSWNSTYYSTTNYPSMMVTFTTMNGGSRGTGFQLKFTRSYDACKCNRTVYAGSSVNSTFSSSNYPQNYFNNENCGWLIKAGSGFEVELILSVNTLLTNDYIAVYDGSSFDNLIFQSSSSNAFDYQLKIKSSSSQLFVFFYTDGSGVSSGFTANYRRVPATGVLTGYLQNLNYQVSPYAGNSNMTWLISGLPTSRWWVNLEVDSLNYNVDSVSLYDGSTFGGPSIFTEKTSPLKRVFITNNSSFQLNFVSVAQTTATGFRLNFYEQRDQLVPCSGIATVPVNTSSGSIMIPTPNAFGFYRPNDNCFWNITVPKGYAIGFTLFTEEMDLQGDYIKIRNTSSAFPMLTTIPQQAKVYFATNGNTVLIGITASSDSRTGFSVKVTWQQIPNTGYLSGYVMNVGYPTGLYYPKQDIFVRVVCDSDHFVLFNVTIGTLGSGDSLICLDNAIAGTGNMIAQFTSGPVQKQLNSTTNALWMQLLTDGANHGTGFILSFECAPMCPRACLNGGNCTGISNCTCSVGWTGPRCETAICTKVQCQNGGNCTAPDSCTCAFGWTGPNCTIPVCSPACGMGGNCTASNNCTCLPGWNGTLCDKPICTKSCLNNGVCTLPDTCTCVVGWVGYVCENSTNSINASQVLAMTDQMLVDNFGTVQASITALSVASCSSNDVAAVVDVLAMTANLLTRFASIENFTVAQFVEVTTTCAKAADTILVAAANSSELETAIVNADLADLVSEQCKVQENPIAEATLPPVTFQARSSTERQQIYNQFIKMLENMIFGLNSVLPAESEMSFNGEFYSAVALRTRFDAVPGRTIATKLAKVTFPSVDDPFTFIGDLPAQCSPLKRNSTVLIVLSAFIVNVNDVNLQFNMPTVTIRVYCQKAVELTLQLSYAVRVVAIPAAKKATMYSKQFSSSQCDVSKLKCDEDNKDRIGTLASFSLLQNAGDFVLTLSASDYKYWVSISFEWTPSISMYHWQLYKGIKNTTVSYNGTLEPLRFYENDISGMRIVIPSNVIRKFKKSSSTVTTLYVYTKKDFRNLDLKKLPSSACNLQEVYGCHLKVGFASSNSRRKRDTSESSDSFELEPESSESAVVFKSKYFGDFGADLVITPNTIEFSQIAANFVELVSENASVLAFQVAAIVTFLVAVVVASRFDRTDLKEWAFLPLISNRNHQKFKYFVSVHYMKVSNFNLGPKIGIRLVGNVNESDWRLLEDGVRKNFKGKHPENFVLASQVPIGRLDAIELRVKQSQILKSMFVKRTFKLHVDRVVVVDVERGFKYIFLAKTALQSGDTIRVDLATENEMKDYTYLVSGHSRTSFTEIHPWLSVAQRPLPSNWTRCERLACVVSALFMAMMVNAMFYGKEASSPSVGVKVGNLFSLSWFTVWTSFIGCCIVIPPTAIIAFIFKHVKRRSAENSEWVTVFNASVTHPDNKAGTSQNQSREKKPLNLPFYCVIIAWTLIAMCIGASAFIVVFYSLAWGRAKSLEWLSGMVLTIVQDILLVQPVKVLLSAIVSATVHNLPNDGLDLGTTRYSPNTDKYKIELFYRLRNILMGIFHHIIYVFIFAAVIGAMVNPYAYIQVSTLKRLVTVPKINQATDTVTNYNQIYEWLQKILIPNLLTGNQVEYGGVFNQHVLYKIANPSMSLLGPIRLRQQRVTSADCQLNNPLASPIYRKFRPLLSGTEVKCQKQYSNSFGIGDSSQQQPFNLSWSAGRFFYNTDNDKNISAELSPWMNRDSEGAPYAGWEAVYLTGGYLVDLPRKKSSAITFIASLRQRRWLDNSTTVLFVDFNLFNVATNLFVPVKIVFESLSAGGMSYHIRMFPLQLYQYNGANSLLIYVVQALWVILLISHLVRIIRTIKKQGFKRFRADGWNWLDLSQILLGFGVIIVFAARIYFVVKTVTKIQTMKTLYVDLDLLISWEDIMFCMFGVEFFLAMFLFFRHLSINKHWAVLLATLSRGKLSLLTYGASFILVTLFFAAIAYLIMGQSSWMFSSYYRSLMTLIEGIIGTVDFSSFSTHFYLFLTMLYNAVVIFFGGNIFVTIILAAHSEVTRDIEKKTNWDSDLSSYMINGLSGFISKRLSAKGKSVTFLTGKRADSILIGNNLSGETKKPSNNKSNNEIEDGIERFTVAVDRLISDESDKSSTRRQMQMFLWFVGSLTMASERRSLSTKSENGYAVQRTKSLPQSAMNTTFAKETATRRLSTRGSGKVVPIPVAKTVSYPSMPNATSVRDYYTKVGMFQELEATPQLMPVPQIDPGLTQAVRQAVRRNAVKPIWTIAPKKQ